MTASALQPPESRGSISMRIQGGANAPFRARSSMLSQLGGQLASAHAGQAALIVSELVTNSVIHAHLGPGETLTLRCAILEGRLRITVTDPGSRLAPQLCPADHGSSGGFGLRIVDNLCSEWGVTRDSTGRTCIWCDLLLDLPPAGIGIPASN